MLLYNYGKSIMAVEVEQEPYTEYITYAINVLLEMISNLAIHIIL